MQSNKINPKYITDMASAFYDSCILFTASDLGVFTYLQNNPNQDIQHISKDLKIDTRGARLLLDGCVALQLLQKNNDTYNNTEISSIFLSENSPADLSKAIRYNRDVYNAWGKLPQLIKSGKPVEKPEIHLGSDLNRTRTFVYSMHGRAMAIGKGLIPHLDYNNCSRLLDIGGGPGTYSILIAKAYPRLKSIVLDLPEVVKVAQEIITDHNMDQQVSTLAGSYHEIEFPQNMDAINFFGMLHQESPEDIKKLLSKAYTALKPGGKIYILDMMTDKTHTQPTFSALFAINMALTTDNGWVFSDTEIKQWLSNANFKNACTTKLPAPLPHWLIEAKKIN